MKKLLALLVIATATASASPQLPVDKAIKIANDYLKENGRSDTWISAVAFEGKVWAVKWNTPVVLTDTKRETGLEVSMDGSYARYVEKLANANSPAVAGVPADRAALSNHRTRSDRPSILGLKH